jgi:hypothetical protein
MALGVSKSDIEALKRASEAFQRRAGRSLWHVADAHAASKQPATLRRLDSLRTLDAFWSEIDSDPNSSQSQALIAITQACFAHMAPSHRTDLLLPAEEAAMLEGLLQERGLEVVALPSPAAPEMTVLRIARPGTRASVRYAGNGVRRVLGVIYLWLRHRTARAVSGL